MADNTRLNQNTTDGDIMATDDIGGNVKVQRVKVGYGSDGSLTDVADADGSRLPVTVGSISGQVLTAIRDLIDSVEENNRIKINIIIGQDGVDGNSGTVSAKTQRVVLASDVGLPAGTAELGHVRVPIITGGHVPHDSLDEGNPLKVGGKAVSTLPALVANLDRVDALFDLFGRQLVSHIDPAAQVTKQSEFTATQTGTAIWTPASGKRIAVTHYVITTGGTTAGVLTLWFGASGDTTFTQGTDQVLFRGEFAPSTTSRPGVVVPLSTPVFCTTADHVLRITTSAGLTCYILAYGYEW